MGVQWKYLWPVLVLAAALTLGLGAALRFLRPASLGERIGVAEGASLRAGSGGTQRRRRAWLPREQRARSAGGASSLLADTRLRYDGLTDGGVPVSPAAYTVTVYSAPAEEGRTFGVDSQGCVYQDNRRYSASPEQAEELTALLERICS